MGSVIARKITGIFAFWVLTAASTGLKAEISTDGTLGPAVTLAGPQYAVTDDLGHSSGSTLFHSFQIFDLFPGESAVFSGPDSIETIIGRVTGGKASFIDGRICSDIRPVNFYFLNPSGIMLGPDAVLDISGAVHLSTADYLILDQEGRMDASRPADSLLAAAPVEAFGFLDAPAAISLEKCRLDFQDHQTFSLIGGDISLKGTLVGAPSGRMNLIGLSAAGEVRLDRGGIFIDSPENGGDVVISEGSVVWGYSISDSALCDADIHIRGGRVQVSGRSYVNSATSDTFGGGLIDIQAVTSLEITDGSTISMLSLGDEDAGEINIRAGETLIQGGENRSGIFATVELGAAGNGGRISIESDSLSLIDNAFINADTTAEGSGGSVEITANTILLDGRGNQALIQAEVGSDSEADGGSIHIQARNRLDILNGGGISTSTCGGGNAGDIVIQTGALRIDNQDSPKGTGMAAGVAENASGNGGNITITANRTVDILNGGSILASSWGRGNGGNVHLHSTDMTIDGQGLMTGLAAQIGPQAVGRGGDILVELSGSLEMMDGARISTNTLGQGDSGRMTVSAANILVEGGSAISSGFVSGVGEDAEGNGGDIHLHVAENLALIGTAYIYADTLGMGSAGKVDVRAGGSMEMKYGGGITSSTYGQGNSGDIYILADDILIEGSSDKGSGLLSAVAYGASGNGGNVRIRVSENLELLNNAFILVSSFGDGSAGNLDVGAGNIRLDGQGNLARIDAENYSESAVARGGFIQVQTDGAVELLNGGAISSQTFGPGDSGDIDIRAGSMLIDNQNHPNGTGITAGVAALSSGTGGNIAIEVDQRLEIINGGLIISSSWGQGNSGSITVRSGRIFIDGRGTPTGIAAQSGPKSSGNGGTIRVESLGTLTLTDSGGITSSSFSTGWAGDISVSAPAIELKGTSGILSEALMADGGNIDILCRDYLRLTDSAVTTSVAGGQGSGGNIVVDPVFIILDDSRIIANAHEGSGGNIRLVSDYYFPDPGSVVQASSDLGIDGTVAIETPETDLGAGLALLPGYRKHPELTLNPCDSQIDGSKSTLIRTGSGGLFSDPEKPLTSDWIIGNQP